MPTVGVLALQGDVREHLAALRSVGAEVVAVKDESHLAHCDALVIPGGESTAISYLLTTSGLRAVVAERLIGNMPVLGTCAGLILLSRTVFDGRDDQWSYGALDVGVRRNGYGRQIASFESNLEVRGIGDFTGIFIRAPRIESVGAEVEVLATLDHDGEEHAVLVRQGSAWGCAFHPELSNDPRLHEMFVQAI